MRHYNRIYCCRLTFCTWVIRRSCTKFASVVTWHALVVRFLTVETIRTHLQTLILIVRIVKEVHDTTDIFTWCTVLTCIKTFTACTVTVFAQEISWVFILTCIAHCCALIEADFLEISHWIRWICDIVSLTSWTLSQWPTFTQSTTRMTLCADWGCYVGIKTIRTDSKTTAVGWQEKVTLIAWWGIETCFGSVLTSFAFRWTRLTKEWYCWVDELTNRTGCVTSISTDVFVVLGDDCWTLLCKRINNYGRNILTTLTII